MLKTPDDFFNLAYERECIRLRRLRGDPFPWTDDPILQTWRFCEVDRENDKTTAWFRTHIRDPLKDDRLRVLAATLIFRRFNRIETGLLIQDILLRSTLVRDWTRTLASIRTRLDPLWAAGTPLFTSAFMVRSPNGTDKLTGTIQTLLEAEPTIRAIHKAKHKTVEEYHNGLCELPMIAGFQANQITSDLIYTKCLEDAPDKNTFAVPGPGTKRGLVWIYGTASDPLPKLQELAILAADPKHWPWENNPLTSAKGCAHFCCEADKYWRALEGQDQKRRYTPS